MDMTLNNTARILVQDDRDAQTSFYQTETQQNQARQEPKVCLVMLNGDVHPCMQHCCSVACNCSVKLQYIAIPFVQLVAQLYSKLGILRIILAFYTR